jgi:hypothetical protein
MLRLQAGNLLMRQEGHIFHFAYEFVCVRGNLICYFYFSTYMWQLCAAQLPFDIIYEFRSFNNLLLSYSARLSHSLY